MTNKSSNQLLKIADNNLKTSIEHRIKMSDSGKCLSKDQYLIYSLGVNCLDVHLNGVLCLKKVNAEELFNKAEDFFGNRSYGIWVRDHEDGNLEDFLNMKGFKPSRVPGSAGMFISTPIIKEVEQKGYTLKTVKNIDDLIDYRIVIKDAFNKTDEVCNVMYSKLDVLRDENIKAYVLCHGLKPVAAATTVFSGDVAGIYYLGVIEEKRGKGLGSYISKIATNSCFEMGAKNVILQASLSGESVYKDLGYKVMTRYKSFSIKK